MGGASGAIAGAGGISSGGGSSGGTGGAGGATTGGGGSSSAGGSSGVGGSGGSAGSNAAICQQIADDYAAELAEQLTCSSAAHCADRQVAAPGCDCRVFIQPQDPFAIEHLSNVANDWFVHDCATPTCPAQCTSATQGVCQSGRCVTP